MRLPMAKYHGISIRSARSSGEPHMQPLAAWLLYMPKVCVSEWGCTLWLFNIAMENDPFIDDFPTKTTIYSDL